MALAHALLRRLRDDESGFTIIEVVVSSLIVIIVSIGVLRTLDAASARSGEQKASGVAANLAQEDQERLRAFRATDLSNYSETRCIQQQSAGGFAKDPECNNDPGLGPLYKVISRTDWVTDSSGTRDCGSGSRADYIRISSTASWLNADDAELGRRRVSIASIVAPRAGSFSDEGSLSIEVINRDGVGRPGVSVTVSGPKPLSGTTDQNGCLFFGYLPSGNYTVNVSVAGLVDANGNTSISKPFGVSNGSVTSAVLELDAAATLNVGFSTRAANITFPGQKADHVSIAHSGLASSWRAYASNEAAGFPEANFELGGAYSPPLFPFTSAYSVYAGDCPGNNPSFYGLNWGANQFATLTPGGTASITVHQPLVRIMPGTGWTGNAIPDNIFAYVALRPEATFGGAPTYCSTHKIYQLIGDTGSTGGYLRHLDGTSYGIPVGAYDMCLIYLELDGNGDGNANDPVWRYRDHNFSAPHALQPLDDGPSGTAADVVVNKPTTNWTSPTCV